MTESIYPPSTLAWLDKLRLRPPFDKKHDVFPVSLLKLAKAVTPGTPADRLQDERVAPIRLDGQDGEPHWEVEAVLDEKVKESKSGTRQRHYLLKFKGYATPTWEPEENCKGCQKLIDEFRADDSDYEP